MVPVYRAHSSHLTPCAGKPQDIKESKLEQSGGCVVTAKDSTQPGPQGSGCVPSPLIPGLAAAWCFCFGFALAESTASYQELYSGFLGFSWKLSSCKAPCGGLSLRLQFGPKYASMSHEEFPQDGTKLCTVVGLRLYLNSLGLLRVFLSPSWTTSAWYKTRFGFKWFFIYLLPLRWIC